MQTAASVTTFPVRAGVKWLRTYHAVVATPVRVRELVAGVLALGGRPGDRRLCAVRARGGGRRRVHVAPGRARSVRGPPLRPRVRRGARRRQLGRGSDQWLVAIFRFVLVPLFLFSGTFFPIEQLPEWIQPLAWLTPLWHGVELSRSLATGNVDPLLAAVNVVYLVVFTFVGAAFAVRACEQRLRE